MLRRLVIHSLLILAVGGWPTAALAAVAREPSAPAASPRPDYVPGQLLVKLKPGATPDVLAPLNQRFGVTGAEPVFQPAPDPRETLAALQQQLARLTPEHRRWHWWADRAAAGEAQDYAARLAAERAALQQRITAQETLIARLNRRQARADLSATPPASPGTTYRLTAPEDTDLPLMARVYATHPAVAYAEPDQLVEIQMVPNDPYYGSKGKWGQPFDDLYGLKLLACEGAWDTTQGEGMVVAVVDTGLDAAHPDIAANVWTNAGEIAGNGVDDDHNGFVDDVHGWDFVSGDADPRDGHGHGTHVSGTIAAVGNNGVGVIGVAPKAMILPVKGLSDWGSGAISDLAAAIRYAAAQGADVMNHSWGGGGSSQTIAEAVADALAQGCVVVAAAGNNNGDTSQFFPANVPGVIAVAATDYQDQKAWFSNKGRRVDVAAPGVDTLSLQASGSYTVMSGTSMASPHTAGVAALVLARFPALTPAQVLDRLKTTSDAWTSPPSDPAEAIGAGRVNARQAVGGVTGPRVTLEPGSVREAAEGANGNGILESSETATLTLTVKNVGTVPVAVTAVLTASDAKVVKEILVARHEYGTLAADQSATNATAPFTMRLGTIQFETPVTLTLTVTLTAGDQVKTQTLSVPATFGILRLPSRTANKPVVGDRFVVWDDTRDFSATRSDLYGYEPAAQREFPITTALGTQRDQALSGHHLAWLSYDDAWHSDVYYADLSQSPPVPQAITQDLDEQMSVAISGRRIIWLQRPKDQWGSFALYVYDLDRPSAGAQRIAGPGPDWFYEPRISGTTTLWMAYDAQTWTQRVVLYDLTTRASKTLAASWQYPWGFQLDGGRAIWYAYGPSWEPTEVFVYDIATGHERRLTTDTHHQYSPVLAGSWAAWQEVSTTTWQSSIVAYDLRKDERLAVTTWSPSAYYPSVSPRYVAWNGGNGIAVAALPAAETPPVLAVTGTPTVAEGQPLTLQVTATDPDGETMTLTAADLPSGASFVIAPGPSPTPEAIEQPLTTSHRFVGHDAGDSAWLAQSFTVPGTGPQQVATVELYVKDSLKALNGYGQDPAGGFTVELQADAGGHPAGTTLASGPLVAPQRVSWNPVTFAAPVDVAGGAVYWLVVKYAGPLRYATAYGLGATVENTYAGGRALYKYPSHAAWRAVLNADFDLAFRVTLQ